MKVPANITADRLMREYLAKVAEAGTRYLPKGDRMAFVSKTRRRIERESGPRAGDPECMQEVLARLGEPEDLVMAERARIDAARIRHKAPDAETGAAAAESVTAPLQHRRINSRWRPATHAWPVRQPGKDDARPGGGPPESGRGPAREGVMRGRLAALLGGWPGVRQGTRARGEPAGPPAGSGPAGPDAAGRDTQRRAGRAESTVGHAPAAAPAGPAPAGESQVSPSASEVSAAAATSASPAAGAAPGVPVPGTSPVPGPSRVAGAVPEQADVPAAEAGPGVSAGPAGSAPPAGGGTPAAGEPLEGRVLPHAPRAGRPEPRPPLGPEKMPQAATPPAGWNGSPVLVPRRPVARRGRAATALAMVGHATAQLARTGAAAARRYPREATALILLGVGGLILPFPFWLFGAAVALWSRTWDILDKWVAFLGPLVFALLGTLVTASVIRAQDNVVLTYSHALRVDIGYLLRAGSLLTAIFLAVRIRHGPRERVPPWRR